jgi:hypothetical protein
MPSVGFEPTIPAFERAKTVHALDSAATVIGTLITGFLDLVTSFLKANVTILHENRPRSNPPTTFETRHHPTSVSFDVK